MTEANEGTSAPHAESNGRVFLGQIEYVYGDRTSPREVLPLHGELVIAAGADTFSSDELAGALIVLAETKDAGKREVWAKRGAAFFQSRARRNAKASERDVGGASAQPNGAQPASGRKGAA